MQSFGSQQVTNVIGANFDVGNGWEYVRIINESGYELNVALNAIGNETIPAWHLMDIPCKDQNTGQLRSVGQVIITGQNLSDISNTQFPSSFVSVVCYLPGELPGPFSVALTRLVSANVLTTPFVSNTGFPVSTPFISASPLGDTVSSVIITNDGTEQLGSSQENGQLTITGKDLQKIITTSDAVQSFDPTGHAKASMTDNGFSTQDTSGNIRSTLDSSGVLTLLNALGVTQARIDNSGNLLLLGNINSGTLFPIVAGDNFAIDTLSNSDVIKLKNDATEIFEVNKNGVEVLVGNFSLINGSALDFEGAGTPINGGTAGTATLYQDCIGKIKRVYIELNGFRTGGANQTIALPTPFVFGAQIWTGGIGNSAATAGLLLLSSGVSQTIRVLTTLSVNGGTVTSATANTMYENSYGTIINGFDTIEFPSGGTANHTGTIYIVGR